MNFKDFLAVDLHQTFFNANEFATIEKVNGHDMRVIVDDEMLQKQKLQFGEGLANAQLLFMVQKDEYLLLHDNEKPFATQSLRFKDKPYRILSVKDDDYTYTIILEGYRS